MDITPLVGKEKQVIQSYGNGGFKINGEGYTGSVLVLPGKTLLWQVLDSTQISAASMQPLFEAVPKPEIILMGTGAEHVMLPPEIRHSFRQQGMAVDAMSTGAACRTYNILLAEGRQVAAALIAVR